MHGRALDVLMQDVTGIRSEVTELRSEVTELRSEMVAMREDATARLAEILTAIRALPSGAAPFA
jgi:hypothetical protein